MKIKLNSHFLTLVAGATKLQREAAKYPVDTDQWHEVTKQLHDLQQEIGGCAVFLAQQEAARLKAI